MKKGLYLFVVMMICIQSSIFAQTHNLRFDYPISEKSGDFYTFIYEGMHNGGAPGAPLMPYSDLQLLLPQGHEAFDVIISSVEYYPQIIKGTVAPTPDYFPLSQKIPEYYSASKDSLIYNTDSYYPQSPLSSVATGFASGHSILSLAICPVSFNPVSKEIRFIKSISISYKTKQNTKQVCSTHQSATKRIAAMVDNPEEIHAYNYSNNKDETADILIISNNTFLPLMQEYITYKESTGYFVITKSTEDIYSEFAGQDEQEQIRNCITEMYETHSIEYVILVGDADPADEQHRIIPHRGLKAVDDHDIPADLYYSNLDGTWDENGNGVWGEVGEGDLFAEVAIGRICIDAAGELENAVHKLISYQDSPVVDDGNKILLVGENLNNSPLTWGGDYMDEVRYGTSHHGFTTTGIDESISEVSTVYDREGSWNPKKIRDHFNAYGLNMVIHMGHSNVNYNMKMYNQDLTTSRFTNDGESRGYAIGYSQGCYNGSFDNRGTGGGHSSGDCFAEKITTMETAEVATIANSRYGWYSPGNTDASSQFYNRYFIDAIFGENITHIGWANAYSKEAETSWLSNEYFRWTAYELNLFGDPSMDIMTAKPEPLLAAIQHTIIEGSTSIPFECDAPSARIALLKNGILLSRCFTDENGAAVIELPTPAVEGENYEISVIAHNKLRYTQQIEVIANSPVIICNALQVDDSEYNNNGIAEYGETILLDLTLTNNGDTDCEDAAFTIESTSPYILFTAENTHTGFIGIGESVTVTGAYSAQIASDIPSKDIIIDITSSPAKEWKSSIILPVGGARPVITDFYAEEISNTPNGRIDAGENARLHYTVFNDGNAAIENMNILLQESDIYINCEENEITISQLDAMESIDIIFDIQASTETPDGFTSYQILDINADRGLHLDSEHFINIGIPGILVCDLDGNHNSSPALLQDLSNLGASADYNTSIPENISDYKAVFLCLGIFPDFHELSWEEGEAFANYLEQGGRMYIESGSLWYYNEDTPLHEMLNIESSIGNGWVYGNEELTGIEGTFGEGMEFSYVGDNLRIDHLEVSEPTYLIFNSEPHTFGAMAALETDSYKVVATTFEWSGIIPANSSSSQEGLMTEIINFMEINTARPPVINLGADTTICLNQQLLLDAGDGFSSYLWSNGATSSMITVDTSMFSQMINEISVTVVNQDGYQASDAIVVNFSDCTGLEAIALNELSVFPNPANESVNISYPETSFAYTLVNTSGKTIYQDENNYHKVSIDTKSLEPNIYLLIIRTKDILTVEKVVIK